MIPHPVLTRHTPHRSAGRWRSVLSVLFQTHRKHRRQCAHPFEKQELSDGLLLSISIPCQSHVLSMPCPFPHPCPVELSLSSLQMNLEACLQFCPGCGPSAPGSQCLTPTPTGYTCFWFLRLGNRNIRSGHSVCPLTKFPQNIPVRN